MRVLRELLRIFVGRPTPTVPTPTPTPTPPPAAESSVVSWEVVRLTNLYRDVRGLRPLNVDYALVEAARAHADDMAARGYFGHISPEGRTWQDRARSSGYPGATLEVIAKGHRTEAEAFDGWMDSLGHRRVLMDANAKAIGAAASGRVRVAMVGYGPGGPSSIAVMLSPEPIETGQD